jgi:hypothetical protein
MDDRADPQAQKITVCYARPDDIFLKTLEVTEGTTIAGAIDPDYDPTPVSNCKCFVVEPAVGDDPLVISVLRHESINPSILMKTITYGVCS